MRRLSLAFAVLAGCSADAPVAPDAPPMPVDAAPDAFLGTPSIEGTPVSSFETTSCSTGTVLALSQQIAEEVDCLQPGQLVPFDEGPVLVFTGSAILPFISEAARADLYDARAAANGRTMQLTSVFRTVVQQYLLRRWFELGRCGITAAAQPGSSNHESGRALDMSNYSSWISTMESNGWSHNIPGDPVHFEHLSSPDIRGADVLAFQRLWNRNAPDDPISEDGDYGPETAERVKRAPAEGFGIGAICGRARLPGGSPARRAVIAEDAALACGH